MSPLTICLIIFVLTVISYCWGKLSMATTALVSMMALVLFGCMTADEALAYFGNNNVVMIGGMCVVAAGFNRTKFCGSIADRISRMAKGSLTKVMAGYIILGVVLSQFIQSPVAVFGIVAPMLASSAEAVGVKPSKVMFPLGVAVVATCCTIPLGAGATVAAELNGYLESYGYTDFLVGLADPAKARLPMLIVCALYCIFVAVKTTPDEPIVKTKEAEGRSLNKAPLSGFAEHAGYIIFILDALGLMFASQIGLDNWEITVIGALAMVVCGVLKPKEAVSALPVSMLLLIVGALAMSGAIASTGAGELIGGYMSQIVTAVKGNSYIVGGIFFVGAVLMNQVIENRAAKIIFPTICLAHCASHGG